MSKEKTYCFGNGVVTMIGKSVNWENLCIKLDFYDTADMFRYYRQSGYTYGQMGLELRLSKSTVWNKAMQLVEADELTLEDLARDKNAEEKDDQG